jgi:hypothetical protein
MPAQLTFWQQLFAKGQRFSIGVAQKLVGDGGPKIDGRVQASVAEEHSLKRVPLIIGELAVTHSERPHVFALAVEGPRVSSTIRTLSEAVQRRCDDLNSIRSVVHRHGCMRHTR